MKISWMLTAAILIVGGALGWMQQGRHERAMAEHREAIEQAEGLGISTEVAEDEKPLGGKLAERRREVREEGVREFARELIDFAMEMKELEGEARQPGDAAQVRMMEMFDRLLDYDSAELKLLVGEIRANEGLEKQAKAELTGMILMMMMQQHPEGALTLFTESSDPMDEGRMGSHMIISALGSLAAKDPEAALKWIRENAEDHPELVTDRAKSAVVRGAAAEDPERAIQLAEEWDFEGSVGALLAQGANTPEGRDALLELLRKRKDADLSRTALQGISMQLMQTGFESASKWLESAELSDAEAASLIEGMQPYFAGKDTGSWIEWAADQAEEAAAKKVPEMMSHWTQSDYRAAGEWLAAAEAGPVKEEAVASYATTVAPYDPEAAAQWVGTLPQGERRREVAAQVLGQWKEGESGREAFAEREGLE